VSGCRKKYPKWLSLQTQHLLILTHASGGWRKYPRVIRTHILLPRPVRSQVACGNTLGLSVHTIVLPRPMRSGVECGDTQGLSAHTHFEDKNVFSHCMPSKATMSSSTFWRRQCLQLLHAFKRRCRNLPFDGRATRGSPYVFLCLLYFLSFCGRKGYFPCSYVFLNRDKEIRPT